MKSFKTILSAGFLASALVLAGCGGGNDSVDDDMSMEPKPEPMPEDMRLEEAVDAAGVAKRAYNAAMMLLEGATNASKAVSPKGAKGSSQMASENAMIVLSARNAIMAQQRTAAEAVSDAEAIDTSDMSQVDIKRIMELVEDAKESLAEIDKILMAKDSDSGSLAMAEAMVKAGESVSASNAMIAQSKANKVAKAIGDAIDATEADAFASDTHTGTTGAPDGSIMSAGTVGMTFAEIEGSVSVSAKGKASDQFDSDASGTDFDFSSDRDATAAATDAWYMGIPGRLVCTTGTCGEEDGKLTGEWLFTASDSNARYTRENYGQDYFLVTDAASYGYWLDADNAIHLHAATMTAHDALDWVRAGTANDDVKATYEGTAGGYSYRTVGKGDDAMNHSGAFTANVTLTATFKESGNAPGLEGNISSFDGGGGMHVNPSWKVRLANAVQDSSQNNFFAGNVENGAAFGDEWAIDGRWSAVAYGPSDDPKKRADGFVGAFDAAFSDGEATGAYHVD